jgi:large subunit ribosomal protein L7/L12
MDKDKFIETVEKMSVTELNDLVKALEEKFGVSASSFAQSAGAGQSAGADAEEEKDSFTVVLNNPGGSKIQVIKALREITGKGLKDAKDMTDNVPINVKEGATKAEAEDIKKKIEDAGGVVELK